MNTNAYKIAGENTYPTTPKTNTGQLPDIFMRPDGTRIAGADQWPGQSEYWRDMIVDIEYGGLPPAAESVQVESLCHSGVRRWDVNPALNSYKIHTAGGEKPYSFCVRVIAPRTDKPVPTIIDGDGCWWYINEQVAQAVVERGYALAIFNRTEMAEDLVYGGVPDKYKRSGGLYDVYPGKNFGALAAWAWGYHRTVDMLETLDYIDASKIAVTGHSRGGKTALLAGVTDSRIALINENASCAGGSALFRYIGNGGEDVTIAELLPSWFCDEMRKYTKDPAKLPFDQHCLLAAAAPRPLLTTYALDDRWSNPEGMVLCHQAARKAYELLGADDKLAFHMRSGEHRHDLEDWLALLDFMDMHFMGKSCQRSFNTHPYSHLQPAFNWDIPS